MTTLEGYVGLVLVAGERMWPDVDALAQWGDQLAEVVIVHSAEQSHLGQPVDRLEHFVQSNFPSVRLHRAGPIAYDEPSAVAAILDPHLRNAGRNWIINASGGSRLTFAGCLLATRERPNVAVVFRDANMPWHLINDDGSTSLLTSLNPAAIDRFTVAELVALTWNDHERHVTFPNTQPEPELRAAARACLDGADWSTCFYPAAEQVIATTGRTNVGLIFERFVLALVQLLGVAADDIAINAQLRDGSVPLQEVDIVVNSGGRLNVIDCKLTEEEGTSRSEQLLGSQIREAENTRRYLGDNADRVILLRPNRVVKDELRSLADAFGVIVVDQITLARESLPAVLGRMLGTPPTAGRPGPVSLRFSAALPSVIDLRADFQQSGEPWRAYRDGDHVVIRCRLAVKRSKGEFKKFAHGMFDGRAQVLSTSLSQSGLTGTIVVTAANDAALAGCLAGLPVGRW